MRNMSHSKDISQNIFSNSDYTSGISDIRHLNEISPQLPLEIVYSPILSLKESEESERSEITMNLHTLAGVIIPFLQITEKTRYTYTWSFNRYFGEQFGKVSVHEITRQDIERIISPLPTQTGYQALMVIRTIFREACDRGYIEQNPTKGIKAPKIRTKNSPFLTWEQVRDGFFGDYDNHIRFLALHGLRWGEAVALTKEDIHDGLVHINRSVHGPTKTQSGVRAVPYLGYFEQFPTTRKTLAKVLKPYGVTIHSLRKTYAYILKTNNVHVTTAQKLLGHASPMVTLSIYTKVLDQETLDTGVKIAESLGLTF